MSEAAVIDRHVRAVLSDRPEVLEQLDAARAAADAAVEPRLLELCSRRVAALLGGPTGPASAIDQPTADALAQWPSSPHFDATDRACLAFTEQFVIDVASLDDPTALAVRDALGDQGFADFVSALLVVEQRMRLHLVWKQLFREDP